MDQYLLDFLESVTRGQYGKTGIQQLHIMRFVDRASPSDIEELDEMYWDWTSILATEEDWDMAELERIVIAK